MFFINFSIFKSINYLAIALAFVLPLNRTGISVFSTLIIILFFFQKDLKGKIISIKNQKVLLALTAFILFNIISLTWVENEHFYAALDFVKTYWYLLIIFPLYFSLEEKYISKILLSFSLGILVSVIASYGMALDLWQTGHNNSALPSPFMHKIDFSVVLAFASLLLLIKTLFAPTKKLKLLFFIFFVAVLFDLIIVSGRTGQFAFAVSIFALVIFSFQNKLKTLGITMVLFTLSSFIIYNSVPSFKFRINETITNLQKVYKHQNYCTSLGMRIGSWIIAKDIIIQNPFFGIGQTDNTKIIPKIVDEKYPNMECLKWFENKHFHNQYIQILTSLGIVGLGLFLLIFYFLAKTKIINREMLAIKVAIISLMLTSFLTEPVLNKQFTASLCALIIGLILAEHKIENSR